MLARNDHNSISRRALEWLARHTGGEIRQDGKLYPIGPFLTTLLPLSPSCPLQRRWFVIQAGAMQEPKIAKYLTSGLRLDAYWPSIPKKRRLFRERYREVDTGLIPGYLFAGFDAEHEDWTAILTFPGVVRVIMIGERPCPVSDLDISKIRELEIEKRLGKKRKYEAPMAIGDFVQVKAPHSFCGLFGYVVKIHNDQHRIVLEMDIFGRKTEVTLEPENVRVV